MNYLSMDDIASLSHWIKEAREIKGAPLNFQHLGKNRTICLLFFNPSLRTRLSTQKAAQNLGMNTIVMNFDKEGWALEFEDGTIMDQGKSEHVKEAAKVISRFCDLIGIRAFAGLEDRADDQSEKVLNGFKHYATVPIVNLESSVGHPLQALADAITIAEHTKKHYKPKVVLSWAPHPKALPHAVANSFVRMMQKQNAEFVITHPKGYELDKEITQNSRIEYDQDKAFQGADFIYAKNWSSFETYGKVISRDPSWMITQEKMDLTNDAKFMHCLPVRRNVVVRDEVLDGPSSLVIEQANNRTYAAQIVLKKQLEYLQELDK